MKDNKLKFVGRPKKAEHEKVQYQRIAVYSQDYQRWTREVKRRKVKITDAFTDMVDDYIKK